MHVRWAPKSCWGIPGATRSCQEPPGAAMKSQGLPGTTRNRQEFPGAARSRARSHQLPEAARSPPGAARGCQNRQEQPRGVRSAPEQPGAPRNWQKEWSCVSQREISSKSWILKHSPIVVKCYSVRTGAPLKKIAMKHGIQNKCSWANQQIQVFLQNHKK